MDEKHLPTAAVVTDNKAPYGGAPQSPHHMDHSHHDAAAQAMQAQMLQMQMMMQQQSQQLAMANAMAAQSRGNQQVVLNVGAGGQPQYQQRPDDSCAKFCCCFLSGGMLCPCIYGPCNCWDNCQ